MFHDDITLDNLSRPQLISMCKYIGVNAFGMDNILKHQIRAKLERVRVDDMVRSGPLDDLMKGRR
jgi:LETM1 and EF-hand domain-containing protein 1